MDTSELIPRSWLTKDGYFDLTKVPLDTTFAQVMSTQRDKARGGLRVLAAIQQAGRMEAGIFLLGFFCHLPLEDLEMREAAIEALEHFRTPGCAAILFAELRRVKSSNATRRYLATILKTLSRFPKKLVESEFLALAKDQSFSCKMRAKFREFASGTGAE